MTDAMHHVLSGMDKVSKIEVKYINAVKGKMAYHVAYSIKDN